jgi:hypothetical protein
MYPSLLSIRLLATPFHKLALHSICSPQRVRSALDCNPTRESHVATVASVEDGGTMPEPATAHPQLRTCSGVVDRLTLTARKRHMRHSKKEKLAVQFYSSPHRRGHVALERFVDRVLWRSLELIPARRKADSSGRNCGGLTRPDFPRVVTYKHRTRALRQAWARAAGISPRMSSDRDGRRPRS